MNWQKEHPADKHTKAPALSENHGFFGFLPPSWNRNWLFALLLVFATMIAYLPVVHAGFIWDDDFYVTKNPLLTAPDGLRRIWFSLDSPSQYFPLTYTSFYSERGIWGLNPTGYHLINLLLHAANALLVWRVLARLRVPSAWLAAAIFALHPVQVESVAWITERKNVLMGFFFLLTLLTWLKFIDEQTKRPWRFYVLALVFYTLALFAKTTACTLPAALLLILWLEKMPIGWRRLAQVAPFVALGLGMGLVTVWWEHYHQGTQGKLFAIGPMERLLIASRALWFYLGKLLWPANLTFSYPRWTISASDPRAYGWLLATVVLALVIWRVRRWAGRSVEVAAIFFAATLAPVLGFIMLYTFVYSFVADHYQYLACIGPIALAVAAMERKPLLQPILGAALLIMLGILTWRQCEMYADPEMLWRATLRRNPTSWMAHDILGNDLLRKGKLDEAIVHFQKALEIKPDYAEAQNNLGNTLLQMGKVDEAKAHLNKALEINPNSAEAHINLGNCLFQEKRTDEAIHQYEKALEINPADADAHNDLGLGFFLLGRKEEAIAQYQNALQADPDHANAHFNLGNSYFKLGRLDDAIAQFQKALQIEPGHAEAHMNLGNAFGQQGRMDEAIAHYQKALDIKPNSAEAQYNLGNAFGRQGWLDKAIAHYQSALEIKPDDVDAEYNLGGCYFRLGKMNEAVAQYQKVLEIRPAYAEAHNNLGLCFFLQGKSDEAISQFQKALELQPNYAEAHYDLGNALIRKGKMTGAIAEFKTALRLKPDNVEAQTKLINAMIKAGNTGEAISYCETMVKTEPKDARARFTLGWVYLMAKQPEQALVNNKEALRLAPDSPQCLNALAWIYATSPKAELRNGTEAVRLAARACEITKRQNPEMLDTLAAAYAEIGRFDDAIKTTEEIRTLAVSAHDTRTQDTARRRLELYKSGRPYRDE